MLTLEIKIDASELVTDETEIKEAITKAIKETIPCQLYGLEIKSKDYGPYINRAAAEASPRY